MAGGDNPFPLSEVMAQSFEQTRKAMENYLDLFQKNIKSAPWLETDLNKKMTTFTEQNIAAVSEFAQKVSNTKDFQEFCGFRQSSCKRNGKRSVSRRKTSARQRLKVQRM